MCSILSLDKHSPRTSWHAERGPLFIVLMEMSTRHRVKWVTCRMPMSMWRIRSGRFTKSLPTRSEVDTGVKEFNLVKWDQDKKSVQWLRLYTTHMGRRAEGPRWFALQAHEVYLWRVWMRVTLLGVIGWPKVRANLVFGFLFWSSLFNQLSFCATCRRLGIRCVTEKLQPGWPKTTTLRYPTNLWWKRYSWRQRGS